MAQSRGRAAAHQRRAGGGRPETPLSGSGESEPGDLLTFSNRGGRVTHVGMYLGEGRFIHSATRGVQVSALSDDDPYGRWWYQRWVGARRILEDDGAPSSRTEAGLNDNGPPGWFPGGRRV